MRSPKAMRLRKAMNAVKNGTDPGAMRRQVMAITAQIVEHLIKEDTEVIPGPPVVAAVMELLELMDGTIDWSPFETRIQREVGTFLSIVTDPEMADIVATTRAKILDAQP